MNRIALFGTLIICAVCVLAHGENSLLPTPRTPRVLVLNDSQKEFITAKFAVNSKAQAIRRAIPRFYGSKEFDDKNPQDYAIGIGTLAVPGFLFAVLTIVWCILFCCCRNICGLCGGNNAKEGGYTKKERWCPYITLAVFMAIVVAFAIVGIVANVQLSASFVGSTTSVSFSGYSSQANSQFGGDSSMIGSLFTVIDYASGLTGTLNTTLKSFERDLLNIITNVTDIVTSSQSTVAFGVTGILARIHNISIIISNLRITIPEQLPFYNETVIECGSTCVSLADRMDETANDVTNNTGGVYETMNNTINQVKETIVDVENEIKDAVDTAATELNDANKQILDTRGKMADYANVVKGYDDKRKPIMIVIFCLPLVGAILVVLAGFIKKPVFLTINYIYFFFLLFVFWIFFGVHLPLAVLTGDSCDYISKFEVQTDRVGEDAGKVIEACMFDTSLLTVFNLTDDLSFRDRVEFPTLPSIDSIFNYSEFDSVLAESQTYTIYTLFNINANDTLDDLNAKTAPDVFGRNNVSSCNSPDYNSSPELVAEVEGLKRLSIALISAENELNAQLRDLQSNISALNDTIAVLKIDCQGIITKINKLNESISPLFDYVDQVKDLATCGFLGDVYYNFKFAYCDGVVGALSNIALSTFFVGLFGVGVVILSIVLKKRMPHPDDDPFSVSGSKKKRKNKKSADNEVEINGPTNKQSEQNEEGHTT